MTADLSQPQSLAEQGSESSRKRRFSRKRARSAEPEAARSTRRRVIRIVLLVATVTTIGLWAAFLRPTFLGGPASYVIVSGSSMEPTYRDGDLVVAMKADGYRERDIAVYPVPKGDPGAGTLIIHRIVDREEEGFETRGDNRDSSDVWRPTDDDIKGRAVASVPAVGRVLSFVRTTPGLALTAGIATFLFLIGGGKKSPPPKEEPFPTERLADPETQGAAELEAQREVRVEPEIPVAPEARADRETSPLKARLAQLSRNVPAAETEPPPAETTPPRTAGTERATDTARPTDAMRKPDAERTADAAPAPLGTFAKIAAFGTLLVLLSALLRHQPGDDLAVVVASAGKESRRARRRRRRREHRRARFTSSELPGRTGRRKGADRRRGPSVPNDTGGAVSRIHGAIGSLDGTTRWIEASVTAPNVADETRRRLIATHLRYGQDAVERALKLADESAGDADS